MNKPKTVWSIGDEAEAEIAHTLEPLISRCVDEAVKWHAETPGDGIFLWIEYGRIKATLGYSYETEAVPLSDMVQEWVVDYLADDGGTGKATGDARESAVATRDELAKALAMVDELLAR